MDRYDSDLPPTSSQCADAVEGAWATEILPFLPFVGGVIILCAAFMPWFGLLGHETAFDTSVRFLFGGGGRQLAPAPSGIKWFNSLGLLVTVLGVGGVLSFGKRGWGSAIGRLASLFVLIIIAAFVRQRFLFFAQYERTILRPSYFDFFRSLGTGVFAAFIGAVVLLLGQVKGAAQASSTPQA